MPRGGVSLADSGLQHALAADGHDVSGYQLERWRRDEQLPRNLRRGRGRASGSTSELHPAALPTARLLAQEAWQGRSRHHGTFAVFQKAAQRQEELWFSERAVRDAFVWALSLPGRNLERRRREDPDPVASMAERARRSTSAYDLSLLHIAHPEHATRRERDLRAAERRKLAHKRAMAVMVLFDEPENVTADVVADAFGSGLPDDELRRDLVQAELQGDSPADLGVVNVFEVLTHQAKELPFDQLCAGRDAYLYSSSVNMLLTLYAFMSEEAHRFFVEVRSSQQGQLFAALPHTRDPVGFSMATLACSALPEITDALMTYATDLMLAILPYHVEVLANAAVDQGRAAEIGPGLMRIALHSIEDHDRDSWHSEALRNAMTKLVAAARNVEASDAGQRGIIERLWG